MSITVYLVNGRGLGLAFFMATEVISWITDCNATAHLLLHFTLNKKQVNSVSTFCVKFYRIKICSINK